MFSWYRWIQFEFLTVLNTKFEIPTLFCLRILNFDHKQCMISNSIECIQPFVACPTLYFWKIKHENVLQGFFNLVIWTWSRPVPESSDFILPIAQSHTGFQLPTLSLWMPNLKSCKNLNCSGATCSGKTLHLDQQKIQYGALVRPGLSEWWNQVDSACNQSLRAICTVMLLNRLVDNKAEARWLWSINSMGGPHHCRVQGYRYTTSTRVHNASWWIHWKNSCEITLLSTILFTIFFTACMICQMISDINYDQNPFRHFTVMSHELRFTKVFEKSMWKIQWNRIWIDDMTMNSELENEFM